jgi:ribosomal protein S18 acetylase RimI-like enzyme
MSGRESNSQIEYRYLQPRDYDEIVRVWQEAGLTYRPQGRDSRERLTTLMSSWPQLSIGAFADGHLVGTILGTTDGRRGCINRVAVIPACRGSGIAKKLIEQCEKELYRVGVLVLFCLVEGDNEASQRLFESVGYERGDGIIYYSKRESWDL